MDASINLAFLSLLVSSFVRVFRTKDDMYASSAPDPIRCILCPSLLVILLAASLSRSYE